MAPKHPDPEAAGTRQRRGQGQGEVGRQTVAEGTCPRPHPHTNSLLARSAASRTRDHSRRILAARRQHGSRAGLPGPTLTLLPAAVLLLIAIAHLGGPQAARAEADFNVSRGARLASRLVARPGKVAARRATLQQAAAGRARKAQWVGLNWGTGLSTKPLDYKRAVQLMKENGASAVKIFSPDPAAYAALQGSGLQVMTNVPGPLVSVFAANQAEAQKWVDANVVPHVSSVNIRAVAVGNEQLKPGGGPVVAAMWAVWRALRARRLHARVKVVTAQTTEYLYNTYPPSATDVLPEFVPLIKGLLKFIAATRSYVVINVYPFFPFMRQDGMIDRDFAFFKGYKGYYDRGLYYQNLFDAMYDAAIWALKKMGYPNVTVVVGETGWPSAGSPVATVDAAAEWNRALVAKVQSGRGTPLRPKTPLQVYLFEALDEDLKDATPGQYELHWGIRYMDGRPKYSLNLTYPYRAHPFSPPPPVWCVVNPVAAASKVQDAVKAACASGAINCAQIRSSCASAVQNSAILNAWFQSQGQAAATCSQVAKTVSARPTGGGLQCPFPGRPKLGQGPPAPTPGSGGGSGAGNGICSGGEVAKVQAALDWACGPGGADCGAVQPGAVCGKPDTLFAHASHVFHDYYRKHQEQGAGACNFGGAARLVNSRPKVWGDNGACAPAAPSGKWCVAAC